MIKVTHQSPSPQLLKDCRTLTKLLKNGTAKKLPLEIDFEHYHYRKNLDLSQIHNRFESALKTLLSYRVFEEKDGIYSLNEREFERFFNSMLCFK